MSGSVRGYDALVLAMCFEEIARRQARHDERRDSVRNWLRQPMSLHTDDGSPPWPVLSQDISRSGLAVLLPEEDVPFPDGELDVDFTPQGAKRSLLRVRVVRRREEIPRLWLLGLQFVF